MVKDEQIPLIDVTPENAKQIKETAAAYIEARDERLAMGREEKKHKDKLLDVVREAEITPDVDGAYRFRIEGCMITVEPRDELLKVKFDEGE